LSGHAELAEEEWQAGIMLAEAIGENRVLTLLSSNLAVAQVLLGQHDKALITATTNLERAASTGLLYTHFESLRCLAEVHYRRALSGLYEGEMDEAERVCEKADELVSPTESRVSQLWLGPLHIEVLLAQNKRDQAREKLIGYQALVGECQSPRFVAEAARLRKFMVTDVSGVDEVHRHS
jgi:hypothetical protein